MKITNRSRALPAYIISGNLFPDFINCPPLTAPIFRLSIYNNLQFGNAFIYIDGIPVDVVFPSSNLHIDVQKFNSYSQRTILFQKGTIIGIDNEEEDNDGSIVVVGYTYYWEI